MRYSSLQCVTVHYSVLQCVTVHCSALQCVTVHYSVLQCVTVHYSALQCVVGVEGSNQYTKMIDRIMWGNKQKVVVDMEQGDVKCV